MRYSLVSILTVLLTWVTLSLAESGEPAFTPYQDLDGPGVQWAGKILRSMRDGDDTCYELYGPLDMYDRPLAEPGRFIACGFGYYDPSVFAVGHRLSVSGNLSASKSYHLAGEKFTLPLIVAASFSLLPDYSPAPPYWRDPYYDPFWGPPFPYPYPAPFPRWRHW